MSARTLTCPSSCPRALVLTRTLALSLSLSLSLSLTLLSSACDGASNPPSEPAVRFPTVEELTSGGESHGAASAPAPAPALDVGAPPTRVAEWTLTAPPPFGAGTAATEAPLLDVLVAGRNVGGAFQKTVGMRCAAEELARFALAHGGLPDDALLAHVLGRCGAVDIDPRAWAVTVEIPAQAEADDDALVARVVEAEGDRARAFLRAYAPAGDREAAAALARSGDHAAVAIVVGHRRARVSAARLDDGRFLVTGTLDVPLRHLALLVNRGADAVDECEADEGVLAPAFRFFCTLDDDDATGRAELVGRDLEGVLDVRAAALLFHRDDEASLVFRDDGAGVHEAPLAGERVDVAAALCRALDARRVAPLPLASAESARIVPLVSRYLVAEQRADRAASAPLALGLLAGWGVEGGVIERARLVSVLSHDTDPGRIVERALASPLARAILLAPRASTIAIATTRDTAHEASQGALGVVFVVHTLHEDGGEAAAASRALARIADERRARNLAPATVVTDVRDAADEARRVSTEGIPPRQALDDAMQRLRGRVGKTVKGTFVETLDPSEIPIHSAFVEPGNLAVLAAATFHRAEGAAWGQWLIFLYAYEPD